ncbi:MAG TPA: YafY family protein [Candidatus Acidoferrales bacterium]|nr:YafY family protein [Candidatus Acidoferrales bacterium]
MKSGRLLAMLLLLQAKGRSSARELAERLEVSQRTVYRDVDALSVAGVPVHAERGATGGIVLADGYRQALTQFSDDELRGLFISGDNPLADIGVGDQRPLALDKLAGALPETQRRAVEMARGRIYVDPRRWKQAAQPREHLAMLRVAIWEDRRVRLHYRDQQRKPTVRVVEPLGLVAKAGIWYLVAVSAGEMRTFRAERILEAQELDERFERPAGFDLVAFWRDWAKQFEESLPTYTVLLRVSLDAVDDVTGYWDTHVLERGRSGWLARIVFPSPEVAVHQLVAWSGKVEIVEPPALRDLVVRRAREVIEQYAVT